MKASLLVELHGWKGIGVERDLFCVQLVGGFFTLMVCRLSVVDRIRDFHTMLGQAKKRLGGEP